MRVITYYFSGTGNTEWACQTLQRDFSNRGVTCLLRNIEKCKPRDMKDLKIGDILCFAFPVYAANIPPIMRDFIKRLAECLPVNTVFLYSVLTTFGYADGCGPFQVAKMLKGKRVSLVGYEGLRIASNTPSKHHVIMERMKLRLEKAHHKINALATNIATGNIHIASGPYRFAFFRKLAVRSLVQASSHLTIDKTRCVQCRHCVDNCPTKSITINEDKTSLFANSCTGCMRCFNNCPEGAILYDEKYLPPERYQRYNQMPNDYV